MTTYTIETLNIFTFQEKKLKASFYKPMNHPIKATILYFHGGGLIFGDRDDLPLSYVELLTSAGIAIVAVDYPLAPETKMPDILDVSFQITRWFVSDFLPKIGEDRYFIMGRSAGGFLSLSTTLYANELTNQPLGAISFYGYYNLNDAIFSVPSRYYLQYPKVSDKLVASLIQNDQVLTKGDKNRYLLYMASRQKGDWMDLLLSSPDQRRKLSIPRKKLETLPPLFVAAAKGDPDVPTRQSRQLANFHPNTYLNLLDLDEHDFDRTHEKTHGLPMYKKMRQWILDLIS